jgi:hypothetical protein
VHALPRILFEPLLEDVGATFPQRDLTDERVPHPASNRTGGNHRQVGGYPTMVAGTFPTDSGSGLVGNFHSQN